MLENYITVVDGRDRHLARLVQWVFLRLSCVTNSKDSYKVHLSINMIYNVELQVLDISILSERLEITTWCVQLILTVRNDNRVCTHFGPLQLGRMTGLIIPMTCMGAFVTRTFL